MSVRRLCLVTLFALLPIAPAAHAEVIACPDLAQAVQVGACPSEEELQFTFTGYCSDNARIYDWKEDQVCLNYQDYRKRKNLALWEVAQGSFQGYLSCDTPAAAIKAAKPAGIEVSRLGRMTRVACGYGNGITFAYRTRAECKVEGTPDCAADPAACRATCN